MGGFSTFEAELARHDEGVMVCVEVGGEVVCNVGDAVFPSGWD